MRMKTLRLALAAVAIAVLCAGPALAKDNTLMMATTTSTDDTGLLPVLADAFKKDTGITLKWVAVGTGKALEHGRNCDVDVLLVHAPAAEKKFVEEGHGVNRTEVMYNDFVLVGPASDPAKVKGKKAGEALAAIAAAKAPFVSRGDDSGTHKKEKALWKSAGMAVPDKDSWYASVGQGMMKTLNIAGERGAYTLVDRGTYIKYADQAGGKPALVVLVEGDKPLLNQYSVISINPDNCESTDFKNAEVFREWMASPRGQKLIGDFTLKGKKLFTPNAAK
ncbi:putative ABC transporter substrate binding protein precursor [Solidesulfovibrio fructosivorans JJ]]|uniref:Putative ABC transporter substrate binding protein n=1 Tax=Solidesulfovibrio fructosivorans JJ] TaxID=596151 RepID=E1JVX5_SOLFR|nr:substrate-binding domain-containing protein [Solidesulfovibrio fructosivorans]EFL51613.1 putative ABC transporter substrate binding protein precursor [Solidesulfovibrio fructosivorans JJ]]